jgi:D-alanyl-D-alanine carboxypeptidase
VLVAKIIKQSFLFLVCLCIFYSSGVCAAKNKRAELVIDAQTGRVLYSYKSDHIRHPASLTKLMTLYIVFEALDSGRLKPYSKIKISKNAAGKPPSKLGIKAGKTITVRDAAYTLIIKSANDIAAAVAEKISGSEAKFAQLMTKKARKLGMTRTIFRNASGLPDKRQVTTARDMAVLAMRLMQKFPHYYKYFSTQKKVVAGISIKTHNHLLKSYKGMDGMKTGYINMSGFNLVSSAERNNKRLITVVMGGKTYKKRDNRVVKLTDLGWQRLRNPQGYRQFLGISIPQLSSLKVKFRPLENKRRTRTQTASLVAKNNNNSVKNVTAPHRPILKYASKNLPKQIPKKMPPIIDPIKVQQIKPNKITKKSAHYKLRDVIKTKKSGWLELPNKESKSSNTNDLVASLIEQNNGTTHEIPEFKPVPIDEAVLYYSKNQGDAPKSLQKPIQQNLKKTITNKQKRVALKIEKKNWTIQVGAFSKKNIADKYLVTLMKENDHLSEAQPELIAVKKGKTYIYRARFSGFSAEKAKRACLLLKKVGRHCITTGSISQI